MHISGPMHAQDPQIKCKRAAGRLELEALNYFLYMQPPPSQSSKHLKHMSQYDTE